jgi:hypothetical protein
MMSDRHRLVERSREIEGKPITLCPNTPELRDDQNDIKNVGETIKMTLRMWKSNQNDSKDVGKQSKWH